MTAPTGPLRLALATLVCGVLTSCAGEGGDDSGGDDCTSHYDAIATAPTWVGLKRAMLRSSEWGQVSSVRVQARGTDVGAGDQPAVLVVDLLGRRGGRLVQADVWRTADGGWSAGVWNQCID